MCIGAIGVPETLGASEVVSYAGGEFFTSGIGGIATTGNNLYQHTSIPENTWNSIVKS